MSILVAFVSGSLPIMFYLRFCLIVLASVCLSACAGNQQVYDYKTYLESKGVSQMTPFSFQHCHGYGCKIVTDVVFPRSEWRDIVAVFDPMPKSAEEERHAIRKAIALFEQKVGALVGTDEDVAGTFLKVGNYQIDCVDESINTTIYLELLRQAGFLRYHMIMRPVSRGATLSRGIVWPHHSAQMIDVKTDIPYVVDSWFHDNGVMPHILPYKKWRKGWHPEDEGEHNDIDRNGRKPAKPVRKPN